MQKRNTLLLAKVLAENEVSFRCDSSKNKLVLNYRDLLIPASTTESMRCDNLRIMVRNDFLLIESLPFLTERELPRLPNINAYQALTSVVEQHNSEEVLVKLELLESDCFDAELLVAKAQLGIPDDIPESLQAFFSQLTEIANALEHLEFDLIKKTAREMVDTVNRVCAKKQASGLVEAA